MDSFINGEKIRTVLCYKVSLVLKCPDASLLELRPLEVGHPGRQIIADLIPWKEGVLEMRTFISEMEEYATLLILENPVIILSPFFLQDIIILHFQCLDVATPLDYQKEVFLALCISGTMM